MLQDLEKIFFLLYTKRIGIKIFYFVSMNYTENHILSAVTKANQKL